jgi:HK97 family phage portal protein
MGILRSIFKRGLDYPESYYTARGINTNTPIVTQETALTVSAVYQAIRLLSESVAGLPVHVYRETKGTKDKDNKHPAYPLLHDMPNPEMTSFDFWRAVMVSLLTWGNAYIRIIRDGGGQPTELYPLLPQTIEIYRNKAGELRYRQYTAGGTQNIYRPVIDIMHIKGLSSNGLIGYAPLELAAQSLGVSLSADKYGASFFANNANPGGVLEHPGQLSPEAYDNLLKSWEERHRASNNAGKVAILEEGMTFRAIGLPPEQAQFLETRRFQVNEVARWFNIPPHMLSDLERATYANVEHLGIEFVTYSLQPYLINIERACHNCLFLPTEKKRYYVKFNVDGLLRGDIKTRFEAYGQGITYGILSANEVRQLEDMSMRDDPGGDVYYSQLNLVPSSISIAPPESVETPPAVEEPQDTQEPQEERSEYRVLPLTTEQRASANARHNLQKSFIPSFEDVFSQIIKRQINDINNKYKQLGNTSQFREWLATFWAEHEKYVARKIKPLATTYAELTRDVTAKEVNLKEAGEITNFLEAYIADLSARHTNYDRAELETSLEEGTDEAIARRFDLWRENGATSSALQETVRLGSAIALMIYGRGGVKKKRWVTFGETCPYCRSLDGRTIAIEGYFLEEGQDFKPIGGSSPLRPSSNVGHAPAHRGCDCAIVASV